MSCERGFGNLEMWRGLVIRDMVVMVSRIANPRHVVNSLTQYFSIHSDRLASVDCDG